MREGQDMTLTVERPVGQLAAEYPLATRVFARHRMDYCCGGGRPLADVCAAQGLDPEAVLREIRRELESPAGAATRWDAAPLPDLVRHIVTAYHLPLVEELPRLEGMARKVVAVHGEKDPERLPRMLTVYLGLKRELEQHMAKEEQTLFPLIVGGSGAQKDLTAIMEDEHEVVGTSLKTLRGLTDEYTPPSGACTTWRALWSGFAALEEALHQHIHLENNVLFPRALAGVPGTAPIERQGGSMS